MDVAAAANELSIRRGFRLAISSSSQLCVLTDREVNPSCLELEGVLVLARCVKGSGFKDERTSSTDSGSLERSAGCLQTAA